MDHRPCPFCCDESSSIFGTRGDIWLRCRTCRSVFRDITADKFGRLHDEAFQDADFLDAVVATHGLEPARAVWDGLSLPGRSLLEIGPGSGHLLAAAHEAGRAVAAVEHSQANRKFIQDIWGIGPLYPDLAAIPQDVSFDAVVAINVLEHVYDIAGFLRSIAKVITPGGVLFVSTSNAVSLEARLLGSAWAMCKTPDHVSFPSPAGMVRAAQVSNMQVERLWSTEVPFELPVSVLVAARDWKRARCCSRSTATDGYSGKINAEKSGMPAKRWLARFYSCGKFIDPTSRLLGAWGRAANVKACLRPVSQPPASLQEDGLDS
jgi:2-polyprenyl-3-methyl-5-hydroxy-6-metoxy-1,4-benzoquinol methylase